MGERGEAGGRVTAAPRAPWRAALIPPKRGERGQHGRGGRRVAAAETSARVRASTERERERGAPDSDLEETMIRWRVVSPPTSSCI